ncbi:hypothetical protein MNBD_ALPHA11-1497 [hydrothermal vent metagenome]|uniref:Uncharacterized protein n=1 Tax=hydrothermal vent metagenome TaxID=652676 RepID=A0A3B0TEX6_9ZZZZ
MAEGGFLLLFCGKYSFPLVLTLVILWLAFIAVPAEQKGLLAFE